MFKSFMFLSSAFGVSLYANAGVGTEPQELGKWVLQQGGLVTAIAILLYFWRRDMHQWRKEQEERTAEKARENAVLIALVKETTSAMAHSDKAMSSCVGTLERLTTVVDRITLDAAVTARRRRMPGGDQS